jgi:hypothetical protein
LAIFAVPGTLLPMTKSGRAVMACLAGAAWVSSCSGGSTGSGGSIPLNQLGPQVTAALCSYEVRCGVLPDLATCEGAFQSDVTRLEADVQAGRVIYDGDKASSCLSSVAGEGCALSDDQAFGASDCRAVFQGTVAAGGHCAYDEHCVSQMCDTGLCDLGVQCCSGTCLALVTAGGECGSAVAGVCAVGTTCVTDGTGHGTCQATSPIAGRCSNVGDCASGLDCAIDSNGIGTCVQLPGEGQPCDPMVGLCDKLGDFCDSVTQRCVPRLAPGASCPTGDECVLYAQCDQTTMKCVATIPRGGACTGNDRCLGTLECLNGVCAQRPAQPVCP